MNVREEEEELGMFKAVFELAELNDDALKVNRDV